MSVATRGLTHIALAVRDVERAFAFYERVFGMVAIYRQDGFIQAQTPGSHDVIVFEEHTEQVGAPGGILHFGFRLIHTHDCNQAIELVDAAGGTVIEAGEFAPDEPYVFCRDPDGYVVEIWYERPTPLDPA
jgi:catechol 2,3-dioxygenase-like lactoylglutathione lyase family enzyme